MKTGLTYLLLAGLLLISGINKLIAQDSVVVLSMNDCIRMGLNQSAKALLTEDSLQMTGAALLGAYGQFLPDLNLTGTCDYLSGSNLLTMEEPTLVYAKETQLNYQLTSTLNIFNGFSDYSALKVALLAKTAEEYTLDRAKQFIIFDVTQSYLQVILDRREYDYAKRNLHASETREAQLKELTTVGRKAIGDLYQQQALTSNDKLYMLQTEVKTKNDLLLLLRKIRIGQTDKYNIYDITVDTVPLGPEYDNVQNLVDEANQQRPDLKTSALNIQIAGWRVKELESGYLPKLHLGGALVSNGGYVYELYVDHKDDLGPQEPVDQALFGQLYGEISLNLSWHLFDRFYNKTNVDIAKIYQRNQEILYDDLTVQISSDVKQAYNNYVTALQQIETANHGLLASSQAYDVVQGEYNLGRTDFVSLSNAQAVLLQAEVTRAQAGINLALQKKIIDYYIGK
jgi:outer membrane protein